MVTTSRRRGAMRVFVAALLAALLINGETLALPHGSGTPPITNLTAFPSATTIQATWATGNASNSLMSCSTTPGVFTNPAVDNGIETSATSHYAVLAGLVPSTTYYCQVTSGTQTATFTQATTATPSSTPLISATLGTPTKPIDGQVHADFFENCVSNDNVTYVTGDDIDSGWNAGTFTSNMSIAKFSSESPLTGLNVNGLTNFGTNGQALSDGKTSKIIGMTCWNGGLYTLYSRLGGSSLTFGSILASQNHGVSWSNFQAPTTFDVNGALPSPLSSTQFANSSIGASCTWVGYAPDSGTKKPTIDVDNSGAYAYLICNDGIYNGSQDHIYVIRIPWQSLPGLDGSKIQYYIGGPTGNSIDGSLDGAWSTSAASIVALTVPSLPTAILAPPALQYMPSTGRYVLVIARDKVSGTPGDTLMYIWDCAHPWEVDTLINGPTEWTPEGFYSFISLQRSAAGATANGTPMTYLFSGNYDATHHNADYQLWQIAITLNTH